MQDITKKRLKASLIDGVLGIAITYTAEYFLRKKIKSEAFHALVTPFITMYTLEYVQLKCSGQTAGYRVMNLKLENAAGNSLMDKQILKRLLYRDTISTMKYLQDPKSFELKEGALLPHDLTAGTIVKETAI